MKLKTLLILIPLIVIGEVMSTQYESIDENFVESHVHCDDVGDRNHYKNLLIEGIMHFEGFYENTYVCPGGVKTIGYGFTDKSLVDLGSITKEQAQAILEEKIDHYIEVVGSLVEVPLSNHQEFALVSFAYNLGLGGLRKLINGKGRLNDGNIESINTYLPLYVYAGGVKMRGLELRRAWEINLFNNTL